MDHSQKIVVSMQIKNILTTLTINFLKYAPRMKLHAFFYKQHFYKQRQAEIGKKLSKC